MIQHPSIDEWRKGEIVSTAGPYMVNISSSSRCNLSCFMCTQSFLDEIPVQIGMENLKPYFEKSAELYLGGIGEPLYLSKSQNPMAYEAYHHAINNLNSLKLSVYTNGVLVDEEMARTMMKRFHHVHFSIDTTDPAVYEKVRGKPLAGKVLENIRRLGKMKKDAGLSREDDPIININTILMESTLDTLPDVARLAVEVGAHTHTYIKLHVKNPPEFIQALKEQLAKNGDDPAKNQEILKAHADEVVKEFISAETVAPERLSRIRKELLEIYEGSGIVIEDQIPLFIEHNNAIAKPPAPEQYKICPHPWTSFHIRENGDVYCCCTNELILGNITCMNFDELINGPIVQGIRKAFLKGEMRGCHKESCSATIDFFSRDDAYIQDLMENLDTSFAGKEIDTILFLRTASFHLTRLAVATLREKFRSAKITLITNAQGVEECRSWGTADEVLPYPHKRFEPEDFDIWWRSMNRERPALFTTILPYKLRMDYTNIDAIFALLDAGIKKKITGFGEIVDP
ncbi:MAG: radical SAM protein [Nitrospinota bacterium]|nr:radical SAM protein [Nitrospinota bacterium]